MAGRKLNDEERQYLEHMLPWLARLDGFTTPQVERVQGLPRSMVSRILKHLLETGQAALIREGGIHLGGRRGTTAARYRIVQATN